MPTSRLHHTFFGGRWYRRWAAWAIFVLSLRSQGLASGGPERTSADGAQANAAVTYENSAPGIAYVGSKVCAGCHQNVYDQYMKTDMGRSMSEVAPSELKKIPTSITIFDKKLDRYFQVSRDASGSYQTEYGLNPDGSLAFKDTRKIEYLMGSGHNGFSCIVRQGNYLFEAPLSFYTRDKTWGLSPGYESQDYGFSRPILVGCAICHSGLPEPDRHAAGAYRDPPFRELAIGCENCHGPGELHVNERVRGDPILADAIDRSIVNPAKLQPWLANNICMNCHQGGDARVLQPGKNYPDFRPGKPLDETLAIFMIPFKRESPPPARVNDFETGAHEI